MALGGVVVSMLLSRRLNAAQGELQAEKNRPAPPVPARVFEGRREAHGLLWFPTLTVDDAARKVTAANAGLPHCAACVKALTLSAAVPEEWSCAGCGDKRPGTVADFIVVDHLLRETLKEFVTRHPGYRLAEHLMPVPKLEAV